MTKLHLGNMQLSVEDAEYMEKLGYETFCADGRPLKMTKVSPEEILCETKLETKNEESLVE